MAQILIDAGDLAVYHCLMWLLLVTVKKGVTRLVTGSKKDRKIRCRASAYLVPTTGFAVVQLRPRPGLRRAHPQTYHHVPQSTRATNQLGSQVSRSGRRLCMRICDRHVRSNASLGQDETNAAGSFGGIIYGDRLGHRRCHQNQLIEDMLADCKFWCLLII